MAATSHHSLVSGDVALSDATIERAREGLAAATSHPVNHSIQEALERLTKIVAGQRDSHVNGDFRRQVLRSLIHGCFQVRVEHAERLPTSAAILCANHLNHVDPFLILSEIPAQPYYYLLGDARTLFNQWWKRLILRPSGGVIPLVRRWQEERDVITAAQQGRSHLHPLAQDIKFHVPTRSDFSTLRLIEQGVQALLQHGHGIILFPEGRLGYQEGQLQLPFKRGAVTYALKTGLPLVPVALIGTQDLYFRKVLTIRFGSPLAVPHCPRPKRRDIEQILAQLQGAIAQLLPMDYQDAATTKPLNHFLNHLFC